MKSFIDDCGDELYVDHEFDNGYLYVELKVYSTYAPEVSLSVNQVKELMAHLQRALDKHGEVHDPSVN